MPGACGVEGDAIITLTRKYATCSACYNGAKQEIGVAKSNSCPHMGPVRRVVGDNALMAAAAAEAASANGDFNCALDILRMSSVLHSDRQ